MLLLCNVENCLDEQIVQRGCGSIGDEDVCMCIESMIHCVEANPLLVFEQARVT